ncbi:MAG: penicillin-binding protein 1A [Burkholderiales bacterium]|nr:penicillin-binding protein 1A [Burkholderiales bacterium]
MSRWLTYPLFFLLGFGLLGGILLGFAALIAYASLPSLEALTDYQPKVPLRIYDASSELIGEFGEERRALVQIKDVPLAMRQAIIAAEDERFYEHSGVDYLGVLRATYANFMSSTARQGASTITMQVARNFFLTTEKTMTRKFNEALLAFKIEHSLSKDEILQLYINQIYLGQRSYGFAAAAQVYYGKNLDQLNLAEIATLAGLPKAPSRYNPVVNPQRAKLRQQYVLRRMRELNFITDAQLQDAEKLVARAKDEKEEERQRFSVNAQYFAELVRQAMVERYGDEAYTKGFKVYTTLDPDHQKAAYAALHKGVMDYDRRHGYRGPEAFVELPARPTEEAIEDALADYVEIGGLHPAVVLAASPKTVKAYSKGGETIEIGGEGLKFSQKMLGDKAKANQRLRRGSVIRVQPADKQPDKETARKDAGKQWQISQLPAVEAALVSMDPKNGAIQALIGGFDFDRNKFNHVTQAFRQPGSSFKPFIYSAALEKGFTPATVINDAPLVIDAAQTGSERWEPKNFDNAYAGPIRLRTALAKSKNLVSIRILQAIGPQYAQDYITRFGFDPKLHPAYLTMALGAGMASPLQLATGYSVFANGGYRVQPYFIQRITDANGTLIAESNPPVAGEGAERVIDPRNAFIVTSLMRDVVRQGTGIRAMQLGRTDLAGKTGTTNDQVDAWFAGFQPSLVAIAWIGFDTPRSLGQNETGSQAALPIWMNYMGKVLKNVPQETPLIPEGVDDVIINPDTGLQDPTLATGGVTEYFYHENLPAIQEPPPIEILSGPSPFRPREDIRDQLF